jgi:hypothetical protein
VCEREHLRAHDVHSVQVALRNSSAPASAASEGCRGRRGCVLRVDAGGGGLLLRPALAGIDSGEQAYAILYAEARLPSLLSSPALTIAYERAPPDPPGCLPANNSFVPSASTVAPLVLPGSGGTPVDLALAVVRYTVNGSSPDGASATLAWPWTGAGGANVSLPAAAATYVVRWSLELPGFASSPASVCTYRTRDTLAGPALVSRGTIAPAVVLVSAGAGANVVACTSDGVVDCSVSRATNSCTVALERGSWTTLAYSAGDGAFVLALDRSANVSLVARRDGFCDSAPVDLSVPVLQRPLAAPRIIVPAAVDADGQHALAWNATSVLVSPSAVVVFEADAEWIDVAVDCSAAAAAASAAASAVYLTPVLHLPVNRSTGVTAPVNVSALVAAAAASAASSSSCGSSPLALVAWSRNASHADPRTYANATGDAAGASAFVANITLLPCASRAASPLVSYTADGLGNVTIALAGNAVNATALLVALYVAAGSGTADAWPTFSRWSSSLPAPTACVQDVSACTVASPSSVTLRAASGAHALVAAWTGTDAELPSAPLAVALAYVALGPPLAPPVASVGGGVVVGGSLVTLAEPDASAVGPGAWGPDAVTMRFALGADAPFATYSSAAGIGVPNAAGALVLRVAADAPGRQSSSVAAYELVVVPRLGVPTVLPSAADAAALAFNLSAFVQVLLAAGTPSGSTVRYSLDCSADMDDSSATLQLAAAPFILELSFSACVAGASASARVTSAHWVARARARVVPPVRVECDGFAPSAPVNRSIRVLQRPLPPPVFVPLSAAASAQDWIVVNASFALALAGASFALQPPAEGAFASDASLEYALSGLATPDDGAPRASCGANVHALLTRSRGAASTLWARATAGVPIALPANESTVVWLRARHAQHMHGAPASLRVSVVEVRACVYVRVRKPSLTRRRGRQARASAPALTVAANGTGFVSVTASVHATRSLGASGPEGVVFVTLGAAETPTVRDASLADARNRCRVSEPCTADAPCCLAVGTAGGGALRVSAPASGAAVVIRAAAWSAGRFVSAVVQVNVSGTGGGGGGGGGGGDSASPAGAVLGSAELAAAIAVPSGAAVAVVLVAAVVHAVRRCRRARRLASDVRVLELFAPDASEPAGDAGGALETDDVRAALVRRPSGIASERADGAAVDSAPLGRTWEPLRPSAALLATPAAETAGRVMLTRVAAADASTERAVEPPAPSAPPHASARGASSRWPTPLGGALWNAFLALAWRGGPHDPLVAELEERIEQRLGDVIRERRAGGSD